MPKAASLPAVRTDPDFKGQVTEACSKLNLTYSTVVTRLLEQWLTGDIKLKMELDEEFTTAAKEAFESNRGRAAFQKLENNYDPNRSY